MSNQFCCDYGSFSNYHSFCPYSNYFTRNHHDWWSSSIIISPNLMTSIPVNKALPGLSQFFLFKQAALWSYELLLPLLPSLGLAIHQKKPNFHQVADRVRAQFQRLYIAQIIINCYAKLFTCNDLFVSSVQFHTWLFWFSHWKSFKWIKCINSKWKILNNC